MGGRNKQEVPFGLGGVVKYRLPSFVTLLFVAGLLGCSAPLTTREKGAGIGALGGAAAGGSVVPRDMLEPAQRLAACLA